MALYQVVPGETAHAADLDQYYDLLVGLMPDQPVTIGQLMQIVGRNLSLTQLTSPVFTSISPSGGSGTLYYYWLVSRSTDGDAVPGASSSVSGAAALGGSSFNTLFWNINPNGAGGGALDFVILRNSVNTLGTAQQLTIVPAVDGQTSYSFVDNGSYSLSGYTATTAAQALGLGGAIEGGVVPSSINMTSFSTDFISAPAAIAGTPMYMAMGSVNVTPNASTGVFSITFTLPFPNGVITALFQPGGTVPSEDAAINWSPQTTDLTILTGVYSVGGAVNTNPGTRRVNFLVIGW